MSDPFGEVPVLPTVVSLGVVLFGLLLWRLHAKRRLSGPRAALAALLSVYAAGIVSNTLFPIFLRPARGEGLWTPSVALIPFFDYEVEDAVTNVLVFLPLGMLIPLLLARPSWWKVLSAAVATSLAIELAQLAAQGLFAGGHVADVNDLIFNTVGGALGYGLFLLLARMRWSAPLVDRFRWTAPAQPS
ncbi:VanZ family protein [Leifsonia sp. NPDC058292]|uniref:VanZ family protein n=1 Tax=Leifsonia sp. NPDC058292 TaxID=3346428 RepID=UPI0036DED5E9